MSKQNNFMAVGVHFFLADNSRRKFGANGLNRWAGAVIIEVVPLVSHCDIFLRGASD